MHWMVNTLYVTSGLYSLGRERAHEEGEVIQSHPWLRTTTV